MFEIYDPSWTQIALSASLLVLSGSLQGSVHNNYLQKESINEISVSFFPFFYMILKIHLQIIISALNYLEFLYSGRHWYSGKYCAGWHTSCSCVHLDMFWTRHFLDTLRTHYTFGYSLVGVQPVLDVSEHIWFHIQVRCKHRYEIIYPVGYGYTYTFFRK